MLTGKMVRVRYVRHTVVPYYLDEKDSMWLEVAERLIQLFKAHLQSTRGELEDEVNEVFGDAPSPQIHQGLAKLLEDRCEFAVVSGQPPEQLRAASFEAAARQRAEARKPAGGSPRDGTADSAAPSHELPHVGFAPAHHFDRAAALAEAATALGVAAEEVERCLFADLRGEQQLVSFRDITPERLLQRYNVALAQAVLLRAVSVQVKVRGEPPQRYRQLLRLLKFHRLMCEAEAVGEDAWCLRLDGPLSLFSATQKYGLQLALFLPALLQCKDFELQAELLWGPRRASKTFRLSAEEGLASHYVNSGMYVPPELTMFVELFRQRVEDWEIVSEPELVPLGNGLWVPDYQLVHRKSGQVIYLEVLGFWRRASVEKQLQRLRQHSPAPFLLAVSDQLHVEEAELEGLPAAICRFRQMPLPQEIARAANELLEARRT
jgi:predicted nuclease of restriction endonuclease-like RecB superfamily